MPLAKSSKLDTEKAPLKSKAVRKRTASVAKGLLKAEQVALSWDTPGLVAGVDEAGRGPLAGPVFAAAVILDDLKPIKGLADSKTLTAKKRDKLYDEIRAKALCCSVAQASTEEVDALNILQATMLAMQRAVDGLRLKPVKVLVDGNRIPKPFQLPVFWPKSAATVGAAICMRSFQTMVLTNTKVMAQRNTWLR